MLKNRFLPAAFSLMVGVSGCSNAEVSLAGHREAIEQTVDDYVDRFGCAVTEIAINMLPTSQIEPEEISLGQFAASAARGRITYSQEYLESIEDEAYIIFSASHESTHACGGPIKHFPEAIELPSGINLVSSTGLNGNFIDTDGEEANFTLIEEGVATVLAEDMTSLRDENPSYRGWADLTYDAMKRSSTTQEQLVALLHDSDFLGFISMYQGIPKEELRPEDIEEVLFEYSAYSQ